MPEECFTGQHRPELERGLQVALIERCPFEFSRGRKAGIRWVEPHVVAVVEQGARKGAGILREAVYRKLPDEIAAWQVAVE